MIFRTNRRTKSSVGKSSGENEIVHSFDLTSLQRSVTKVSRGLVPDWNSLPSDMHGPDIELSIFQTAA